MLQTISGKLTYPFSEVARVNSSLSYRNDRTVFVSSDLANLVEPNRYKHWAIAKTEYVFDNTRNVDSRWNNSIAGVGPYTCRNRGTPKLR